MTKDLKQGLAIGVAFASLVAFAMPTKAEEMFTDDEICEKSIKYSFKYMPEEDDATLHQARWQIIDGERTDDMQKFVGLIVFELGQRIGYSFDSETMGGDEWWEEVTSKMYESCETMVEGLRRDYGYGDGIGMESANPDEAW